MSFQLFCFKMRCFVGKIIRMNRSGVTLFFISSLSNELTTLCEILESSKDDWTLEESEHAESMMDQTCMRMELEENYREYQTTVFITDGCGEYCMN